jgi:hypothetical protein
VAIIVAAYSRERMASAARVDENGAISAQLAGFSLGASGQ